MASGLAGLGIAAWAPLAGTAPPGRRVRGRRVRDLPVYELGAGPLHLIYEGLPPAATTLLLQRLLDEYDLEGEPTTEPTTEPAITVLLAQCQTARDLRKLGQQARQHERPRDGLYAIVSHPDDPLMAAAVRQLLDHCDGVIGLPTLPHHHQPPSQRLPEMIRASRGLLDGCFIHGFIGYQPSDLLAVVRGRDVFAFAAGRLDRSTGLAVDQVLDALQLRGVPASRAGAMAVGVLGGPDLTLAELDVVMSGVVRSVRPSCKIAYYSAIREDLRGRVELSILGATPRL